MPTIIAAPALIGHEARFAALANAALAGRVPQTLLISGEPHLGKSTFTHHFAKLLLCKNPLSTGNTPLPCGECISCHQVSINSHPDYAVFRPQVSAAASISGSAPSDLISSIIGVDLARKFSQKAQSCPIAGNRKVLVMEQADRMNTEAQNALLKTFEEPARGLTIILQCDNASALLDTVRSRCLEVRLGLVNDDQIEKWLRELDPQIEANSLSAILRAAHGRPGLAWREWKRSNDYQNSLPRMMQMEQWVGQFAQSLPVAALRFSNEAQEMAMAWWEEDLELETNISNEKFDLKGADSKVKRSAMVLFLDVLAAVYRARWRELVGASTGNIWADGLDQIAKTRHYILRNANMVLASDILFCRLLAMHRVH